MPLLPWWVHVAQQIGFVVHKLYNWLSPLPTLLPQLSASHFPALWRLAAGRTFPPQFQLAFSTSLVYGEVEGGRRVPHVENQVLGSSRNQLADLWMCELLRTLVPSYSNRLFRINVLSRWGLWHLGTDSGWALSELRTYRSLNML